MPGPWKDHSVLSPCQAQGLAFYARGCLVGGEERGLWRNYLSFKS